MRMFHGGSGRPGRLAAALLGAALVVGLLPAAVLAASPTVSIDQAVGQPDPTATSPITFTVVFSESVTGFATGDVSFTGSTVGGTLTGTVTGSGATYSVAVTGMTTSGTVVASIPAGVAQNGGAETNLASTSSDNTVTWDVTPPTVTINQAAAQADPTGTSPINFTVIFSETVTGFATGDVSFAGSTAGGSLSGTVTGSGATYNVAVSGMTSAGTVVASIAAAAANDLSGNASLASTSTDNSVTWTPGGPSVTVNQAAGQADPTKTSPINFTVVFSSAVTGFTSGDVVFTGSTAGGSLAATVTGGPTTYNIAVAGMTTSGTVVVSIPADAAVDGSSRPSLASTSTDNTVNWDVTSPTVTINQAAGQADPTGTSPINFTVVFNKAVTGFATGDVSFTGSTSGGTKIGTVSGSGAVYNVAVTGMTTAGTVVASIPVDAATDGLGNLSSASTSTDNSVTWTPGGPTVTVNQAVGQADPTSTSPINFTVVFSATVTGFATGDVTVSGTAGGTKVATVTGSGAVYNIAVSGMTTSGTVVVSIPADVAVDSSLRPNAASTSTDNTVTWNAGPTVTINQAAGQADPTSTSPINFTVVFSASVTGFATGDVTIGGTAGGTKVATVTGSGTTYNVAVTGMTTGGTVIATIPAGVAVNASSQSNVASTSTDNTVTWVAATAAITLTNSASVITWGSGISLNVQFGTGGANRSFVIEGARDGVTWVTIATLTTNASGHATLSYRPVTNLYYRARFLGATDLLAATSNTTRTVVRQIAILRPTNLGAIKSIARNTSITFTTTVRPARVGLPAAKVTFVFYRRVSGVWTRITTRNVFINSLGKASTTFKFTSAGSWYVRSIANPTTYNANSVWSPLERYSVR